MVLLQQVGNGIIPVNSILFIVFIGENFFNGIFFQELFKSMLWCAVPYLQ